MKILIAPDSFKDALPALKVCEAIQRGILTASPNAEVRLFPLADGGEGTAEVLAWHMGGEMKECEVNDPLFRPVRAQFFLLPKGASGKMAFVEMAQASGLQLLSPTERNPLKTSTFGTGELILEAMRHGATEIYLAIGGSATNDAGMGMAAALGWRFLDELGAELEPVGGNLSRVVSLKPPSPDLSLPKITVLSDVTNPLFGPTGAAQVFAPQKGADAVAVKSLDDGLRHFSAIVEKWTGQDFSQEKSAGAAGGLGFGALAFLAASIQPGAETLMELLDFEAVASKMDLIATGEGKLDSQTAGGKLLSAVGAVSKITKVPTIAICGKLEADAESVSAMGFQLAVQLQKPDEPLAHSLAKTAERLEQVAHNVLKTILL